MSKNQAKGAAQNGKGRIREEISRTRGGDEIQRNGNPEHAKRPFQRDAGNIQGSTRKATT